MRTSAPTGRNGMDFCISTPCKSAPSSGPAGHLPPCGWKALRGIFTGFPRNPVGADIIRPRATGTAAPASSSQILHRYGTPGRRALRCFHVHKGALWPPRGRRGFAPLYPGINSGLIAPAPPAPVWKSLRSCSVFPLPDSPAAGSGQSLRSWAGSPPHFRR